MTSRFRRRTLFAVPALAAAAQTTHTRRSRVAARTNRSPTPPRAVLHDDGSYDVDAGSLKLRGAYPAIDDVALRPRAIQITRTPDGGSVRYDLSEDRSLRLTLAEVGETLGITVELMGFPRAPHWVYPLAGAEIVGADRFFKQGLGFGGPSGLFDLPRASSSHEPNGLVEQAWSHDSLLVAALVAPTGETLALHAIDPHDFLQRTTFYNHTHRKELVDKKPASDRILVEAGFSTEEIPLPGGKLALPTLHARAGPRPADTLELTARAIAKKHQIRLAHPPWLQWDSWYEFFEGHDGARLDDTLAGLRSLSPPLPFRSVLLDAGYSPLGDWLVADERIYPGGLQAALARIAKAGFAPGIWVSPFMVSSNSRIYQEHPEWVVRQLDGKPLVHGAGKPLFWIYATHEERYYLDSSHPGAFAYLRDVFRTYRRWGVSSYKVDFLEWGFKDSTEIRRHTPGKTSVQYFVDVIRMIREEIGPDSYFLACIAPFAPVIGFADGVRVGYDVDNHDFGAPGMVNMFRETLACNYQHNILWQNDPDVLYVRDGTVGSGLSDTEIRTVALWHGILGLAISTSDRPHRIPPDRLALLRFVQPAKRHARAEFPLWGRRDRQGVQVAVRHLPERDAHVVLLVNLGKEPVTESLPLVDLTGSARGFAFSFGPGTSKRVGQVTTLDVRIEPRASALFWISRRDRAPDPTFGINGEPVPGLGHAG